MSVKDHLKDAADEAAENLKSPDPTFSLNVEMGKGTAALVAGALIFVGVNMIRSGLKGMSS